MCRDTPKPKDDDYLASRQKTNTLKHFLNVFLFGAHRCHFPNSCILLFFTCDLLTCPICQHSSLLTLSCLCFYLLFITPPYSSVLSPSSAFFIPPLLIFFPGLISLLSPLDHGPPHTAIMQLDREIVWLLKCVCVCEKVWNIVFTKQTVWPTVIHRPCLNV